jgi:hypothetical protein
MPDITQAADWLLGPEAPAESPRTHLLPRWISPVSWRHLFLCILLADFPD